MRPIDGNEVGAKIQAMYIRREMDYGGENEFCRGMRKALRIIEDAPTIESEPVKRGRWKVNGDRFYPFCSNCKYEPPKELIRCSALSLEPILTKYCPNCGSENGTRIYKDGENDE